MSPLADVRRRKLESIAFLALVLITTALFAWMIRAFIMPVFWAAVFAVLFHGSHARLLAMLRGRRAPAALVATLTVILFVVLPFALVLAALTRQGLLLYQAIASGELSVQGPIDAVERWLPAVTGFLARYGVDIPQLRVSLQEVAAAATQFIASRAFAAGQNVLWVTLLFGLMLYLLFFFFRDGERIVAGVARVLPLGDERRHRLLEKFVQVAQATVKGNLVVAAVQGGLGAVLFWIVGIQTAVFWGVVMAVLSLLPAVGAGLVWVPAAIILFAGGQVWQGVLVTLGGIFVIGLVDNVLRPILVGRDTKMPDYLILISTLGGIAVFGLAGFVAGPVIAALCLVLWEMFAEEYSSTAAVSPAPPRLAAASLAADSPPTPIP
ncbi:MAG TPA: AI-2E family transporter [Longimicrobiales bacterium]|nr:AI-2E family transporter [Longimicrobiales bacterium]